MQVDLAYVPDQEHPFVEVFIARSPAGRTAYVVQKMASVGEVHAYVPCITQEDARLAWKEWTGFLLAEDAFITGCLGEAKGEG